MIEGIGLDLVELKRIGDVLSRQNKFSNRILTERELAVYEQMKPARRIEFLAGRFAAKEAYAKACGSGIGKELSWQDIEVIADESGKPRIFVAGVQSKRIHVSITHSQNYAAAQVIIESF
ncbi:MAG TPA: holo-ACP synthase [Bacillales bacterium]|nr:holo-ACP synthase [Bacillales bacterium]